jgi:hypothetical protein
VQQFPSDCHPNLDHRATSKEEKAGKETVQHQQFLSAQTVTTSIRNHPAPVDVGEQDGAVETPSKDESGGLKRQRTGKARKKVEGKLQQRI